MAAVRVLDVMDLVHHDTADTLKRNGRRQTDTLGRGAAFDKQIPQNLRRHDDNLGIGAHLDIARQNTYARRREELFQVVILLVRERFNGRRIEDALAAG